jgi:hypothetical protein
MSLSNNFEAELREATLDSVEDAEIDDRLRERIRELLTDYQTRHDYHLDAVVDAVRVETDRSGDTVTYTAHLPHPSFLFEMGTSDHVITPTDADVLSFVWERRHDPPQWVREQYEREGDGWRVFLPEVEVSGLPEGRFVRGALDELRRELEQ